MFDGMQYIVRVWQCPRSISSYRRHFLDGDGLSVCLAVAILYVLGRFLSAPPLK